MYRSGVVPDLKLPSATPTISDGSFGPQPTSRGSSDGAQRNESAHRAFRLDQAFFTNSATPSDNDKSSTSPKSYSQPHPPPSARISPHGSNLPPHGTDTPSKDGPAAKILHIGREHGTQGISGYVVSVDGIPHYATAVTNSALDGNVISAKDVVTLGLEIQHLEGTPSDAVDLVFGSGNSEKSIGKVTLQWTMDTHPNKRYPPLTVECEVSESYQSRIVFGRPFLDARAQLWPLE